MVTGSIYDRIKFYVDMAGFLPDDFEVEEREYKENELRFAPGAMEGIMGHHVSGHGEDKPLVEILKGYLEMSCEEALEHFEDKVAMDGQMASARSGICKVILEHKAEYNAGALFALAQYFAVNGNRIETVKLGLTLLTLFDTGDKKKVCHVLRVLGCCEEFTDYVLTAAGGWSEADRQELYFELAKKLHGWGKITAVERMVADTEEKKEWLLCYGCKNSVMNAYLGYVCAMKCDFGARLERGNLTEEEFRGAVEIMDGLLDEGPCEGLSAMEKPEELALLYLEECGKHFLDVDLVVQLADIRAYFDEEETILVKTDSLLSAISLQTLIADNMADKSHQCIRIAKAFGLDISDELIELMESDFAKYYQFCYYLFEKDAHVDEFFRICEREVVESDYPNGMGNSWGFGAHERRGVMLDVIVQHLGKYPLCGKKMIRICLHSPITRWRNMAGKALLGWVKELGGTLADIDQDLYDVVEEVAVKECNEGTKETWKMLLGR